MPPPPSQSTRPAPKKPKRSALSQRQGRCHQGILFGRLHWQHRGRRYVIAAHLPLAAPADSEDVTLNLEDSDDEQEAEPAPPPPSSRQMLDMIRSPAGEC